MSEQDLSKRRTPYDAMLTYRGQTFRVRYRDDIAGNPEVDALQERMLQTTDWEEGYRLKSRGIILLVEAWELLGEEGQPLPVTEEAILDHTGPDLLDVVLRGVQEHMERLAATVPMRLAPEHTPPPNEPGRN